MELQNFTSETGPIPYSLEFEGGKSGPILAASAGVHGNEKIGIEVLEALADWLISQQIQIITGKIVLIIGNPEAVEKDTRFRETDLNREFAAGAIAKTQQASTTNTEQARAQVIAEHLKTLEADQKTLVDLHSTILPSEPFIVSENTAAHHALCDQLSLAQEIYSSAPGFDGAANGIEDYANALGWTAVTYELGCSSDGHSRSRVEQALQELKNILAHQNIIGIEHAQKLPNQSKSHFEIFASLQSQDSFVFARTFKNGEKLPPDTLIGYDGPEEPPSREIRTEDDCHILFPKGEQGKIIPKGGQICELARQHQN